MTNFFFFNLKGLLVFVVVEVWRPDESVPVRGCGASACPRQNHPETEKLLFKLAQKKNVTSE